jgi:hypothetical protein
MLDMRDLISSKISPIELAKTIRSLKGVSKDDGSFSKLLDSLISEDKKERINQILTGSEQEDEFAVFCRLVGTCSLLNRIDQNPLLSSGFVAPDFIATFEPRCPLKRLPPELSVKYRCFVEVKLCQEKVFKISKKDINRRRGYAENYGLPLMFAIKFKPFENTGLWLLIGAKELEEKGRSCSLDDLVDSYTPILFDDYTLFTSPSLHFVNYYSLEQNDGRMSHHDYGKMIATFILLPDHDPIEISSRDQVLVNIFLDSFDHEEVSVKKDGDVTAVVRSVGGKMRFLTDVLFKLNHRAVKSDGSLYYDPARVIASVDSHDSPPLLLDRRYVDIAVSILNGKANAIFFGSIGNPEKNYRRTINLRKKS